MTEPATDAIRLEGVTKRFGSVVALENVDLTVESGTYHCLVGPNGSGKSTLLRVILGLARPDAGQLSRPDARIGCGFQQPNFYPGLTVRENLDVFAGLVDESNSEWTQTVLEELRLEPALGRRAADLSGGFARKLDLALAFVKQPEFLLLDEPLGALDDVSVTRLLTFLEEYVDRGNTVLVSTHNVTSFESSLQRVTLMHRGSIVFDTPIEDLEIEQDESLQSHYVDTVLQREELSP